MKEIHICDYASQPDIRIYCTREWTTPSWTNDGETDIEDVYLADNELLYTFNPSLATCENCLNKKEKDREILK